MRVDIATEADIPGWLDLAAEVEPLFGPLVHDPIFNRALLKNIRRGTAFCIRENEGPPGSPLMGGLLFSPTRKPVFEIGWFSVADKWRRHGVGLALVRRIFDLVTPPAELIVKTFMEGVEGGGPARVFYARFGFEPAELLPGQGPYGSTVQVFRQYFR